MKDVKQTKKSEKKSFKQLLSKEEQSKVVGGASRAAWG